MRWRQDTIPYSFRGLDVRGYAEDEAGAWIIEHDPAMTTPFCLYRFLNDEAARQYQLVETFETEHTARRHAEREALEMAS